jgi:hypothetical protein
MLTSQDNSRIERKAESFNPCQKMKLATKNREPDAPRSVPFNVEARSQQIFKFNVVLFYEDKNSAIHAVESLRRTVNRLNLSSAQVDVNLSLWHFSMISKPEALLQIGTAFIGAQLVLVACPNYESLLPLSLVALLDRYLPAQNTNELALAALIHHQESVLKPESNRVRQLAEMAHKHRCSFLYPKNFLCSFV